MSAHVSGVQPQTFGVPPPPQVSSPVQVPQSRVPPQPSEMVPQFLPCAAHVVGMQPHTFGVPPPPHVSGDPHDPQSSGCGHVPFGIVPQFLPCSAQVVGLQHTPNGFDPGGAPLTQWPLQHAWFVRQSWPSPLHAPPCATGANDTMAARAATAIDG
jgi:hypothetical protein